MAAGSLLATASAMRELYGNDPAGLAQFGRSIAANTSLAVLYGPLTAMGSIGALAAWRSGTTTMVLVALFSMFTVVRHTRADEEAGRLELIGATPVGRRAPLAAALILVAAADAVIGVLIAAGMVGLGEPLAGSAALGAGITLVGWCFAGIAALTAQIASTSRAANGMAGAALGAAFLVRAAGDTSPPLSWLSWLTPLGLAQRMRPYGGERLWVAAVLTLVIVALVTAATMVAARRDLGTGLVQPRPGPADAAPSLRTPLALAWRLHRAPLRWWLLGVAIMGLVFGGVAQDLVNLLEDNPQLRQIIEQLGGANALLETFFATVIGVLALAAAAYALQAVLRLQGEESTQRADPVLAAAVSRRQLVVSHLLPALGGAALLLAVAGLAVGLAHGGPRRGLAGQAAAVLRAAAVQVPAVWVVAGVALAVYGLAPRLTVLAWGALATFMLFGQLGQLLELPQWVLDLSPFTHVPSTVGGSVDLVPLAWLLVAAGALIALGTSAFERRDLA